MQKLLAKYGLAAHLALLAVAPLLLFRNLGDTRVSVVVFWLSVPAVLWLLASPSVRRDEMPHDARRRCWRHILRDPLLWLLTCVVAYCGLRACNIGIAKAYDPELSEWYLSSATVPWFAGSVGDAGWLPFAVSVASTIVIMGARHALGGAARMAFLFLSSLLSGLAALIAMSGILYPGPVVASDFACGVSVDYMIGSAYGLGTLCALIALVAAIERKWNFVIPLFALSIGGNVAGCLAYSGPAVVLAFAVAMFAVAVYSFCYLRGRVDGSGEFKYLALFAVAVAVGGMLAFSLMPENVVAARMDMLADRRLFEDGFRKAWEVLTGIAVRTWLGHMWLGAGCGATQVAIEFGASASDWSMLPIGISSIPNGWLRKLMEVGIVGMVAIMLPLGMLAFAFVRRFVHRDRSVRLPHPACWLALVALLALAAVGLVDVSPFRAEVLVLFGAVCAVSVNSIQMDRG